MALLAIDLNPPARTLRQFGFIAFLVFGVLAYGAERDAVTWGLGALAGLSALFSLVAPRANRPLFVLLSVVSYPVGFVVSHVLLALLFFGLITPLALVMKLLGRDALSRRTGQARASYWLKARAARPMRDYFRQY